MVCVESLFVPKAKEGDLWEWEASVIEFIEEFIGSDGGAGGVINIGDEG